MRAPGAPTNDEIKFLKKNRLDKVAYYHAKYNTLREGIHTHAVRVDSSTRFAEFLSEYPVDYAFVCIDQRKDCDSPRQDVVYAALSEAGVPFIDSGVSITVENDSVSGAVTTSAYAAGSLGVEGCHTERQGRGQCARLSQRPAAGSECVGGVACRDGVAAPHGTIRFEIRVLPAQISARDAPHYQCGLTERRDAHGTPSHLRRRIRVPGRFV